MPRGGGGSRGGGGGGSGGGGRRSYSTGRSSNSPSPPRPSPSAGQRSGQPGMMKQMAVTAGGVAAGTILAHAIMGAARESIPPEVQASCSESGACKIPDDDPCRMELKNFINCAYQAQEMTACDGYNTLLKECRRYTDGKYGKQ